MTTRVRAATVAALVLGCAAGVLARGPQRGAGSSAGSQGRGASAQTPTAPQQPGQQPLLFRAGIELVQVDVVVVGPDGNAIRGLTEQDFVVRDRGKPQTVSSFQEISHEHAADAGEPAAVFPPTLKMDVSSNQTARADRLVVMVVDDLHIFLGRTERAKDLARQIILQLGAQASMAVLFTSGEHNTQVTEDRSELLAAADTLKGRSAFRRPHPAIDAQMPVHAGPETDGLTRLGQISTAQQATIQDFEDNMAQYKTLQNAAAMLGADGARRKAFVMLSEGIAKNLSGIFGAMNASVDATPGGAAYAAGNDPAATMAVPAEHYHDFELVAAMAAMQRSSVATYIIDPRGEVKPQDLALEDYPELTSGLGDSTTGFRWDDPVRQAQDGLGIFAQASGGFAVTNTNDFTSGLQHIIEDLDHYYLIGFSPSDPKGTGYRQLDVKIPGHPDWTLRFRRGYVPGQPPQPKNDDPLVALSAGVMPKSDLPLRLWATAFPSSDVVGPGAKNDSVAIALEVTAPTSLMKEPDGKLRDDVSYEVLPVDNKKSKVMAQARTRQTARFAMSGASTGSMPDSVSYQIPIAIDLPPGQYQLRVSASSVKLGAGGSVYLTVDVPDFSKDALMLSGIAVGYADGAHVPVGHASTVSSGVAPAHAPESFPFEPSLSREFTAADTLRVYAEVTRSTQSAAVQATVDVLDGKDHVVSSAVVLLLATDKGQIDTRVPLKDLAAGAYRVRITLIDGQKATAMREIGMVIK
jgi:VWFA-related protein